MDLFLAPHKVYLSGPISLDGKASEQEIEENIQRFEQEAAILRGAGHTPLSPINNSLPQSATWQEHMRADLAMLLDADEILLLPGWQHSRGATLELFVASQLGIAVRFA